MSRKEIYRDDRLSVIKGYDHILGRFYQLFDKEIETPEGEGLVFDWYWRFDIETNFTGIPKTDAFEEDAKRIICEYLEEFAEGETRPTIEQFNEMLFSGQKQ